LPGRSQVIKLGLNLRCFAEGELLAVGASTGASRIIVLSQMARPRADVGEAEFPQKLSDMARMKVDAEPLGDDALEVVPTPAHDPVLLTIRAGLDDLREVSQLLRRQARLWTFGPMVDEALRTRRVEAIITRESRAARPGPAAQEKPQPTRQPISTSTSEPLAIFSQAGKLNGLKKQKNGPLKQIWIFK
jgi:hypothetical protein